MQPTAQPLPLKDKTIIGMLVFFLLVAVLEAWWLLNTHRLVELSSTSFWARLFQIYGDCDASYYDRVSPLSRTLETINVCFSQFLNVALIHAIVKRKQYRHALQLCLASYLTYSLVVYYMQAHLSGYADMKYKTTGMFLLFYGVNAPWIVFYFYMARDSFRAIVQRFAPSSAELARAGVADGQRVSRVEAGPSGVVVDDEATSA
jgi:EXPERA (EXPanded EBP superfamily)